MFDNEDDSPKFATIMDFAIAGLSIGIGLAIGVIMYYMMLTGAA